MTGKSTKILSLSLGGENYNHPFEADKVGRFGMAEAVFHTPFLDNSMEATDMEDMDMEEIFHKEDEATGGPAEEQEVEEVGVAVPPSRPPKNKASKAPDSPFSPRHGIR